MEDKGAEQKVEQPPALPPKRVKHYVPTERQLEALAKARERRKENVGKRKQAATSRATERGGEPQEEIALPERPKSPVEAVKDDEMVEEFTKIMGIDAEKLTGKE